VCQLTAVANDERVVFGSWARAWAGTGAGRFASCGCLACPWGQTGSGAGVGVNRRCGGLDGLGLLLSGVGRNMTGKSDVALGYGGFGLGEWVIVFYQKDRDRNRNGKDDAKQDDTQGAFLAGFFGGLVAGFGYRHRFEWLWLG